VDKQSKNRMKKTEKPVFIRENTDKNEKYS
jgi:hypothetical protein